MHKTGAPRSSKSVHQPLLLLFTLAVCLYGGSCTTPSCTAHQKCGTTPSSTFVQFSVTSTTRKIFAKGCPGYDWTSQDTPNSALTQCLTYTVPLNPVLCNETADVGIYNTTTKKKFSKTYGTNGLLPVRGAIGVAINGVAIYGNSDAEGNNAYVNEGSTFDDCGGHPDPSGTYHYHANPEAGCVYNNTKGKHSPLWGFMADGIPIFGAYGDNGVVPTNLDKCGGCVDKSYPFYHYHSTYNYKYPYTVACFHGKVSTNNMFRIGSATKCTKAKTQYDYSSLKNYGI